MNKPNDIVKSMLIGRDILSLGERLRRLLDNDNLCVVASSTPGGPPELMIAGRTIGIISRDENGDFVVAIPVRRVDLAG